MGNTRLGHVSIRTPDLGRTVEFYEKVIGLKAGYRPEFKFGGVWLYRGGDEADLGTLHVIEVHPATRHELVDYLGEISDDMLNGSGAVDHIAFLMNDVDTVRQAIESLGLEYSEKNIPSMGLHQMFVKDPSNITVELNFPIN